MFRSINLSFLGVETEPLATLTIDVDDFYAMLRVLSVLADEKNQTPLHPNDMKLVKEGYRTAQHYLRSIGVSSTRIKS